MYETFYGLTAKPFQLNPDPTFYFDSRGHHRALSYLEYGLHQSEGFIVITGEVGAGKTTLVRHLVQKLDPEKVVAAQLVSTQLDAEDILRLVSAAFGLRSKRLEKADILLGLEMFLVSLTAVGKRALLIVDEAQNLTQRAVEELRMLSNFQLGEHALLQSFLVGQPEFRDIMQGDNMQQLRQRVIASYHLGPMDAEETRAYIEHRLSLVGWKENPRFEGAAFDAVFGFTKGIPRRINTLCDRLLLAGFLEGKKVLAAADVDAVVEEMKSEAGSGEGREDSALPELPGQLGANVIPLKGATATEAIDAGALEMEGGDEAAQARDLALRFQAARIEERLVRLEKTMGETLALLQRALARPKAAGGKDEA
ncbi:MAG: XrtA-associated ATPase [Rhodocyclaceae bacterium]